MSAIQDRVIGVLTEKLMPKKTVEMTDDLIKDLGADSLDLVELVMAIEDEFQISIPEDRSADFVKVSDIVEHLEKISAN